MKPLQDTLNINLQTPTPSPPNWLAVHTLNDIQRIISQNRTDLEERLGLSKIGVFGSFCRGEQTSDSDLDILVEFKKPMGLIQFMKRENHLSDLLHTKVDFVNPGALKPRIGKRILEEVQ